MRKLLTALVLLVMAASFVTAQTPFSDYEDGIQEFADGVASSLPLNSAIGLNWSSAHIGQFPHFGVGATLGFSTIPYGAVRPVLDALQLADSIESGEAFEYLEQFGAPLPAYAIDARVGGFILPFDVGVKFGTLPEEATTWLPEGLNFDYLLAGFDVRYALIEQNLVLPAVSVGAGYNRLNASIGIPGLTGGDIEITSFEDPRDGDTYDLSFTDPEIEYFWEANVIDLHAQVSKDILLFTPYAGIGASLGFGRAGASINSELQSTPELSEDDISEINAALEEADMDTLPELGENGFSVSADMTDGWAVRVYGGVSINILLLKIDLSGMYDFLGGNYGFTLGTRIQL
ncbi:MAG: hypothetical protein ACOCXN_03610 [Spirochaetota bacterium]